MREPLYRSCLRMTLVIDPLILNFSMMVETEISLPILGMSAMILSYPALSRKTALLTFSLTLPLVHFLTPPFF